MSRKMKPESPIEEIHRVRREISDRFDGDISAIAADAARRAAESGRPMWRPKSTGSATESGQASSTEDAESTPTA